MTEVERVAVVALGWNAAAARENSYLRSSASICGSKFLPGSSDQTADQSHRADFNADCSGPASLTGPGEIVAA
jgi:hypothetical protein